MENVVAQICHEGGASLTSHQLAAQIPVDLKLWRREFPCVEDASWPWDAMMVRRDAQTQGGHDRWCCLLEARKNKETTYPELGQGNGLAQLVVIAGEEVLG